MPISDYCSRMPVIVYRNDTVADACRLMRDNHVGSLVVVDAERRSLPIGILTDRDVAIGVVALSADPKTTLVEAAMRPGVAVVRESDSVRRAIEVMRDEGVRRLPVVDAGGRLVGVLAADDLLELLAGEISQLAVTVSRGMTREHNERVPVI